MCKEQLLLYSFYLPGTLHIGAVVEKLLGGEPRCLTPKEVLLLLIVDLELHPFLLFSVPLSFPFSISICRPSSTGLL